MTTFLNNAVITLFLLEWPFLLLIRNAENSKKVNVV